MSQLHSGLLANHRPYADVYPDAATRLAATGFMRALGGGIVPFASDDLYKKVLQIDDASEWVLTAITPTWVQVSGGSSLGNVIGQSSSVDSEIALFSGTLGKTIKRATGSGLVKSASGVYSTVTAPSGAVVGDTDAQTLLAKTLTTPIIAQINDSNGNETLKLVATASAVNEVTITNKATGNAPTIEATGGDTNIGLNLKSKGTGAVQANGLEIATSDVPQTLTDGATVTWATGGVKYPNAAVTLGGNRTLAITDVVSGQSGTLIVKQDGTGSRTLTLPAGSKVRDGGAGAITLSTAANSIDILTYFYDGTNYFWTYAKNYS